MGEPPTAVAASTGINKHRFALAESVTDHLQAGSTATAPCHAFPALGSKDMKIQTQKGNEVLHRFYKVSKSYGSMGTLNDLPQITELARTGHAGETHFPGGLASVVCFLPIAQGRHLPGRTVERKSVTYSQEKRGTI